eukprot:SM000062S19875  [mRNA]  locus=s62:154828:160098:+ [translate_table: standard]
MRLQTEEAATIACCIHIHIDCPEVFMMDGGSGKESLDGISVVSPDDTGSGLVDPLQRSQNGEQSACMAPRWFTPLRLLGIFCMINMLNYVDRGAIASNGVNGRQGDPGCEHGRHCDPGSGIQGEFHLSNFQDGILPAAFMIGLLVASPIFAGMSKVYNPFRLIGAGLSVWTVAVFGCSLATGFIPLTICRMFVGVGEASFVSLAAPFIDDNAPLGQKTKWLASFYMCIPAGVALGYVYGGVIASLLNWRAAFWLEALLMLPFAFFGFVAEPLQMHGTRVKSPIDMSRRSPSGVLPGEQTKASHDQVKPLMTWRDSFLLGIRETGGDVKVVLSNKIYILNLLADICHTAVLGAYAFWGPKAARTLFHIENADLIFGLITILTGIVGTLSGGAMLDYLDSTIKQAFRINIFQLMSVAAFIGGLACFLAFMAPNLGIFIPIFAVGEFFLFAVQGPVNIVVLQSVTPGLRPLAMALCTIFIHVCGDVPSPPLLGLFQDKVNNWRVTMGAFTLVFLPAVVFWAAGSLLTDRVDESTSSSTDTDASRDGAENQAMPLLVPRSSTSGPQ